MADVKLSETDISAVAAHVADWWSARLMRGDRDQFRSHLTEAIAKHLSASDRPFLCLECDYDPRGMLLDAVHAAGIECRGMLFSADGILPRKHETSIYPAKSANPEFEEDAQPARLVTKEGYGRWNDPVALSDIIAARLALSKAGGNNG